MFRSINSSDWQIAVIVIIYDLMMLIIAESIKINLPTLPWGISAVFALCSSGVIITLLGIGAIITRNGQEPGDPS